MALVVVAALSARLLAEAAARDGHEVVALDLFGDADTRRAAPRWHPIGQPGTWRIDGARVLAALRAVASERRADAIGWIAGSGFEGRPDLIAAGAGHLPLIGTAAEAVQRVRDPVRFFATLDDLGIVHPSVRFEPPPHGERGWLLKDANGSGGRHIRAVAGPGDSGTRLGRPWSASQYFQREVAGTSMSATFIADGRRAQVVGVNELTVRALGAQPHVYFGAVGPVAVDEGLARAAAAAVRALTAAFALRGWCSLDFIATADGGVAVLEVNPRPPASLALYAPRGQVDAQVRACLRGELPPPDAFAPLGVNGHEIVCATRRFVLTAAAAAPLAARPDAHDLPTAGTRFAIGDPVCSVSAAGNDAAAVRAALAAAGASIRDTLEP